MSQLIITDTPAQAAGEQITRSIQEHTGDIVCLLSGGSALAIVEHITPGKKCFHTDCAGAPCQKTECRTIFMLGDERVSGERKINNFYQLQDRYPGHPVLTHTIPTVPAAGESDRNFASRIEAEFFSILTELNNPKILYVLGVGTDGHTAGIFPMDEASFRTIYQDDLTYALVPAEGLRIDSRASFTPHWILNNADELIGYVVGPDKQEILTKLNSEDKKLSERPAELLKRHTRATVYTDQDLEPIQADSEDTEQE